jgi:hypothetical protein
MSLGKKPFGIRILCGFYLLIAVLSFISVVALLASSMETYSSTSIEYLFFKDAFTAVYYVYGISAYGVLFHLTPLLTIFCLLQVYTFWTKRKIGFWLTIVLSGLGFLIGVYNLLAGLINYALVAMMANGAIFCYMAQRGIRDYFEV